VNDNHDWIENCPFYLWMTMSRLDMVVPKGWRLSNYWAKRSDHEII
jgi:hypothetical protein